ncbi:MAG: CBS domain-containing protein [Rhodospirillales bacterium]
MNVSEAMMTGVVTVDASRSLVEAAKMMHMNNTDFLPVVEDERLIGVITGHDIVVRGIAESHNAFDTAVREVMSIEVVCSFADQSLDEARALMDERRISRLPVIDAEHRIVGLLMGDEGLHGTSKKGAVKVTFSKNKTDSYGRPRKVPLRSVYITSTTENEAAVSTAVKRLENEEGTAWNNVADEVEIVEDKNS